MNGDSNFPTPQGADNWTSGDGTPAPSPSEPFSYSEQSQQLISAINQGMLDERVTQIDGNGPDVIFAQIEGVNRALQGLSFSSLDEYMHWLQDLTAQADSAITWQQIEEDRMGVFRLPQGARVCIFLPPASEQPTFAIRKHTASVMAPEDFVASGTVSKAVLEFLQAATAARANTLFVGQMGSGKTTLLRALAQGFGAHEKIGVVEQIPELSIDKPFAAHYQFLPTVEGLTLEDLLDFQLYNSLDRLIVGEVHGRGITQMIDVFMATEGSMSTFHAFTTEQAAERMMTLLTRENPSMTKEVAASMMRQAVELVVVLEKVDGIRRVTQVTEIDWRSTSGKGSLGGRDLFVFDRERGIHVPVGRPDEYGRLSIKARDKYQVPFNDAWFVDPDRLREHQRRIAN